MLEPGHSVDYVWDDLALDRRLVVCVIGKRYASNPVLRPHLKDLEGRQRWAGKLDVLPQKT
jgi:hypothetical protein